MSIPAFHETDSEKKPSFSLSLDQPDGDADIPSKSLLDSSNSPDFGSLFPEPSSGLHPDHPVDMVPVPIALDLDDETEAIPFTDIPRKKVSSSNASRLALLVLLLVAAGVAIFHFDLIGLKKGKKSRGEKPSETIQVAPAKNPAMVSGHERNILDLKTLALLDLARSEESINCESALFLLWFFHEQEFLESCSAIQKNPINPSGNEDARRLQAFRALNLHKFKKTSIVEKFYMAPPVSDPLKSLEDIIRVSRNQNRDSIFWRFMEGILEYENGQLEKAQDHFLFIRNLENETPLIVHWFLAFMEDEVSLKALEQNPQTSFWSHFFSAFHAFKKLRPEFSLLFFQGEFPRVVLAESRILESVGKRFRGMNKAFSALSAWEQGQLDTALSLCERALSEDPLEDFTGFICMRMQLFHGQIGRFSTTVSSPEEPHIMISWLIDGRRNPAMVAWEEYRKNHPEASHALLPLIQMLGNGDKEEIRTSIQVALQSDAPRAVDMLWTGIWQRPDLLETVLESVEQFQGSLEERMKLADDFLAVIQALKSFREQDWEKLKEGSTGIRLKGSSALELDSLVMYGRHQLGRDMEPRLWADTQLQRVSPSSRGASVLLSILGSTGKLQQAHAILDKYQELFREPLFYKSAAQLYLQGTRRDRLTRARFFAEKAVKANPQDFEALFIFGFVQLESGQHESGSRTITQGVAAMEKPVASWFLRWSELESRLKRQHMALNAMNAGLAKIPDHGPFLFRKAQILATQDNPKEALYLLERTRNAGIPEVQRHILEGRCHFSLRQRKEAENAFSRAAKADSGNILARFLYGKSLLGNGKTRPALGHLEFVAQELEKLQKEQAIPEEAAYWQTESTESMLMESSRLLSGAYKESGNRSQAIRHARRYAELAPEGPLKEEALRLLLLLGSD